MAFTISDNDSREVDLNSARSAVEETLKLDNLTLKNSSGDIEESEVVNNTITAPSSITKKYGIIQDIITKSKKEDPLIKARRILNENCKPKEEINVECIGDVNYRVGFGVHLVVPFLKGYEDCFMYIKEVEHEWKNDSLFISKLTLTPSRVMDEVEWSDLDDDDSTDNSTSGSDLWEKIYKLLKQEEGKSYVWGAHGPDTFDCSGLVEYCYNQFKDELGITLGWTTYEQCKQGKEIGTDKGEWAPGDLLFWIGEDTPPSHVSIYIGGDKMIHAPKTGDVVKTVDVTRTDIYTVRRVIPEQISLNIDDSSIPSDYASHLTAVDGNCSSLISNMKKYGYKDIITKKSNEAGVDPYIIAAIIAIESEGNPNTSGSYSGLMQTSGGSSNPETNIEQGINEYKEKMNAVGSHQVHVVLSAYNSGQGTVLEACKQAGYDVNNVSIKELGDALYTYVSTHERDWDPDEKKYYASKVIKAYGILKSKKALE
ncbi:NlpC/P60 family protein [uncultured Clostridium sp.]|uniref:NlpC/P60 family protein n=1 Tax=uncultured Clostridium sp. TaxID=59620 RepID=UPI0028EF1CFA|nr:NlpC/P60 family protein [uncultured Clostridium sp.]